jgi:hypothetical protein
VFSAGVAAVGSPHPCGARPTQVSPHKNNNLPRTSAPSTVSPEPAASPCGVGSPRELGLIRRSCSSPRGFAAGFLRTRSRDHALAFG